MDLTLPYNVWELRLNQNFEDPPPPNPVKGGNY